MTPTNAHADPVPPIPAGKDLVGNQDVLATSSLVSAIAPNLSNALEQRDARNRFGEQEDVAVAGKKSYEFWGKAALLTLVIALVLSAINLAVDAMRGQMPAWMSYLAWINVIPILILIGLGIYKPRTKWLQARYRAERIRQWLFQQFLNGEHIENLCSSDDPTRNEEQAKNKISWSKLSFDLGQAGALNAFLNRQSFKPAFEPTEYRSTTIWKDVRDFYLVYRLNYQVNHFEAMLERYDHLDRKTEGMASWLLILGGILAFLEPISHLVSPAYTGLAAGAAVSVTIVSAGIRVFRSATAVSEHHERYATKANIFASIRDRFEELKPEDVNSRERGLELMVEAERLAHEELVEFLRALKKSDYFM